MPTRTQTWAGHTWRVARSRWWLVIIPFVLAFDFSAIPHKPWQFSRIKTEIFGPAKTRSTAHGRPLHGRAHLGDDGLEWLWPWDEGFDQPEASRWEYVTVFIDMVRRTGAYHLTHETRRVIVHGPSVTPADIDALHAVLIRELESDQGWVGSDYPEPIVETLRRGGTWTRVMPEGYRRDLVAAALAVAWVGLLTLHVFFWFLRGRWRAWVRWGRMRVSSRRRRASAAGGELVRLRSRRHAWKARRGPFQGP